MDVPTSSTATSESLSADSNQEERSHPRPSWKTIPTLSLELTDEQRKKYEDNFRKFLSRQKIKRKPLLTSEAMEPVADLRDIPKPERHAQIYYGLMEEKQVIGLGNGVESVAAGARVAAWEKELKHDQTTDGERLWSDSCLTRIKAGRFGDFNKIIPRIGQELSALIRHRAATRDDISLAEALVTYAALHRSAITDTEVFDLHFTRAMSRYQQVLNLLLPLRKEKGYDQRCIAALLQVAYIGKARLISYWGREPEHARCEVELALKLAENEIGSERALAYAHREQVLWFTYLEEFGHAFERLEYCEQDFAHLTDSRLAQLLLVGTEIRIERQQGNKRAVDALLHERFIPIWCQCLSGYHWRLVQEWQQWLGLKPTPPPHPAFVNPCLVGLYMEPFWRKRW